MFLTSYACRSWFLVNILYLVHYGSFPAPFARLEWAAACCCVGWYLYQAWRFA